MLPSPPTKKQGYKSGLIFIILSVVVLVSVSQFDQIKTFFLRAIGQPARIVIDTQNITGPLDRSWRNLAQGGESHDWRLAPINNQVRALNPEYIRLDHIYDFYDVVQGSPGDLRFDFSQLDVMLNDIQAVGAKPYISLSYMPPAISRGDIVEQPHYWIDWQLVVQKTIEHISGTRNTDQVYYEVWNEPDLFGSWNYYGDKNYLNLYAYAARGAAEAEKNPQINQFYLGGPATTGLYKNWFDSLAKYTLQQNLKFDFFSWHRYAHSLNAFEQDLSQVKTWLARYPDLRQIELHITEWGLDSDNHPGYDGSYGAAHTVAGAITLNQMADKAFVFEIQDGKDPNQQALWGRWGLLTHQDFNSQPKPRYEGLLMLDRISSEQLLLTGQGTWVKAVAARNQAGNTEFVMANADRRGRHTEKVPMTFINVQPGDYILSLEYLDQGLQRLSLATENNMLETEVVMPANSVVYGELSPAN